MSYINKNTYEYPITEEQIRRKHSNISFSEPFMAPEEYVHVFDTPLPIYDSFKQTMREVGPTLTDKGHWERAYVVEMLPQETIDSKKKEIQNRKWEEIKAHRDKLKEAGVKVGTNWFHSDTFSRTQQIGLVMMGASVPAIQWKTMDNTFVTMSQTVAMQIFQATAASDANLFAIAEGKKSEMMSLEDPTNYDVLTGWPPTHS